MFLKDYTVSVSKISKVSKSWKWKKLSRIHAILFLFLFATGPSDLSKYLKTWELTILDNLRMLYSFINITINRWTYTLIKNILIKSLQVNIQGLKIGF